MWFYYKQYFILKLPKTASIPSEKKKKREKKKSVGSPKVSYLFWSCCFFSYQDYSLLYQNWFTFSLLNSFCEIRHYYSAPFATFHYSLQRLLCSFRHPLPQEDNMLLSVPKFLQYNNKNNIHITKDVAVQLWGKIHVNKHGLNILYLWARKKVPKHPWQRKLFPAFSDAALPPFDYEM